MDMMLLGELVSAANAGQMSTGFWMPAGGNEGVGGVETFLLTFASGFDVHLDTKSSDEDDSAAVSIGSVTLSSTTPQSYRFDVTDAKDLVRYRVESQRQAVVHLQFAQPLWQPN
jgi:hypothetical protein